jgi:hypothetical protein
MRPVQRISALLGWLAILATGLLLIAEATGIGAGRWRQTVGDVAAWIDRPDLARWTAALLGVLIGLVALAVLVAQFIPAQLNGRSSVVDRGTAGSTRVTAAAIRRAVSQRLRDLPGVVAASPIAHRRRLDMRVEIGQGANAEAVTQAARAQLDEEFWGSLGTEAIPVDVHLTYGATVVRTEQETA